jgi:F1F0 ATPase subunit 2
VTEVLLSVATGALAGLALSAANHLALWWTVRRVAGSRRPARLLALSSLVRLALVAAGLAVLAWASPWALIGAAGGFLSGRTIAIARVAPPRPRKREEVRS